MQETLTPTIDTDVPASALPTSEPEGIRLLDGTFLAYDQTMEVFRTMTVLMDRLTKNPHLLGIDKETLSVEEGDVKSTDWALCYLWAITKPARDEAGGKYAAMEPLDFNKCLPRSAFKVVQVETLKFLNEMNPDPNAIGGAG